MSSDSKVIRNRDDEHEERRVEAVMSMSRKSRCVM